MSEYRMGTKCVQAGYTPGNGEPRQVPIIQSTTFKYSTSEDMGKLFDLEADGYFYSRLQNPTNDIVAANIQVESNIAIINGIEQFSGTSVTVPDLRAGAALVIAGLAAQGVSVLEDIVYIKRGYEDFAEKLTSLGGIIEEVETEKDIQRFRLKNGTTNW